MNLKVFLMYLFLFSWFAMFANPMLGIGEKDGIINEVALKFLIMGIVVPSVAVYMLYKDENSPTPSKGDIAVTVVLSMVIIWFGYEISEGTAVPVWLALMISFILGLFSLSLVMKLKDKILGENGLLDKLVKEAGKWIAKRFGNHGE
tara:strand:- start:318 stop:758 length:441 start_codon:yes stop_codon:yes gene_type:complete